MIALEILKEIDEQINKSSSYGFIMEVHFNKAYKMRVEKAIKELEDLRSNIEYSIEEIEYALAKPEYADVYLNNALRFLREV